MTAKVKVRKADADKVLAAVKKAYKSWVDAGYTPPKLVKDWDWTSGPAAWSVVWEEGPYDWAILFPFGGIEEEFGFKVPDVSGSIPDGVFFEPINGWSGGIFPA